MNIYSRISTHTLLIIFLLGMNLSLFAQDSLQIVMGTVRNATNYEPISFAIVQNEMLKTRIISDEKGKYNIPINRGDLLKITAIGFEDGFYIVNDSISFIHDFPIQLKPRVYELKEFTLTPYKTVMQFKHAVANLKLTDENPFPDLNLPFNISSTETNESGNLNPIVISGPISLIYNTFSHHAKMLKKYNKLVVKDYETAGIEKRLKKVLIEELIPFKSTEEMDNFIAYCQFDFSFLLNMTDYELIALLQTKYKEYLQKQYP